MAKKNHILRKAQNGDIHAFQQLFAEFQEPLKSYLYRLLANRADAEDLAHDTFIRAFDKLDTFRGESGLKTWTFSIATRLAYNLLRQRNRWKENVSEQAKQLVMRDPQLAEEIERVHELSPQGRYEIREHIDTCFTCISRTLPIEGQVALILKEVYAFTVKEIMAIMDATEGQVKYYLQKARKTMIDIFDRRCALVSKKGICHQCSELNGWLNPEQDQEAERQKIRMVREAEDHKKMELYKMRTGLVRAIDPLRSEGHAMQEMLMQCNRIAMGEA